MPQSGLAALSYVISQFRITVCFGTLIRVDWKLGIFYLLSFIVASNVTLASLDRSSGPRHLTPKTICWAADWCSSGSVWSSNRTSGPLKMSECNNCCDVLAVEAAAWTKSVHQLGLYRGAEGKSLDRRIHSVCLEVLHMCVPRPYSYSHVRAVDSDVSEGLSKPPRIDPWLPTTLQTAGLG